MSESDRSDEERSFPSSIPIRSPSPDIKNRNRILKTLSPTIQIRKDLSHSIKEMRGYDISHRDENEDLRTIIQDFEKDYESTDVKRLREKLSEQDKLIGQLTGKSDLKNSRQTDDLRQKLAEKDRTISDLKKVIATLSEKSQISQSRSQSERIRALEIENERLGEIVRKLNKKDVQEKLIQQAKIQDIRIEELLVHNKELEDQLTGSRRQREEEAREIRVENSHLKERVTELMQLDERNRTLQNQNERLLRLLTDKKYTAPEASPSQENEIIRLQSELKILKEKCAPEKLSLLKIREQYNEGIRLFKEQVYREVESEFQRTQHLINGLRSRLEGIESNIPRLSEMQKSAFESPIKLVMLSKSHLEETADLNSEIKREREKKIEIQDKFEQLLGSYNSLLRDKEEEGRKYHENTLKSATDLDLLRREVEMDRQKHYEELEILKNAHEAEMTRLNYKFSEEVNEFKGSTSNEVSRVVDNYNQEIIVLKAAVTSKNSDIERLHQQLSGRDLEYRSNLQVIEERARNESNEISRLVGLIAQKESMIRSLKDNKQEIEDQGEVRKRSQTQLQSRYKGLEGRCTEILGNYSDLSTKYNQLMTRNNQLEDVKRRLEETARGLGLENEMIPQLNNKIRALQHQLLHSEEELQERKVESERIHNRLNSVLEERFGLLEERSQLSEEMGSLRERLSVLRIKSRTSVEGMSRLQTQISNPKSQFFEIVEEIAIRIINLQKENSQLRVSNNKFLRNYQIIDRELVRTQHQVVSLRAECELLKGEVSYLNQKVEVKNEELCELRRLMESRTLECCEVLESGQQRGIDLSDIQRLKEEYTLTLDGISTSVEAIKNASIDQCDYD